MGEWSSTFYGCKKRGGIVICSLTVQYIKTGVFENEYGKIIRRAFEIRNEADYEDFYVLSKDDAVQQLTDANKFTDMVKNYLKNQI